MSIENTSVASIMTRIVRTVEKSQNIKSVAKIMVEHGIGSIVITESRETGLPIGIITERDIVRQVALNRCVSVARDVMSQPVITIDSHSSLKDAIQTMQLKDIRRLPVVEKGKMVGIITDKDIFSAIARSQSLAASFMSESLMVEYRPTYERFIDFMQNELLLPDKNQ